MFSMKRCLAASALLSVASSVAAAPLAARTQQPHSLCTRPAVFYHDCGFKTVAESVSVASGATLKSLKSAPKAVEVPKGCKVLVYSKSSFAFTSSHPSPLGATKTKSPFIGSRCFSKANKILTKQGGQPINWNV